MCKRILFVRADSIDVFVQIISRGRKYNCKFIYLGFNNIEKTKV